VPRTGKEHENLKQQLYGSCGSLDVGPQPISQLELEQGAKLVRHGARWIKRFDREAVEVTYHKRFAADQHIVPGLHFRGEPILCLGARLGGEVRALTRLGALAIGVDFNPGFRNPHVLWGDALNLQFADSTFKIAYTNVLDHMSEGGISVFVRQVFRVLKPGGILLVDIDAHEPDKYARSDFRTVVAAVERSLVEGGMSITGRRPFCKSNAEWFGVGGNSTCVLGNPTAGAGIDPAGGVSLVARKS
jgi:SAM-dependent methyltransferase